jgi:hypothetical protein
MVQHALILGCNYFPKYALINQVKWVPLVIVKYPSMHAINADGVLHSPSLAPSPLFSFFFFPSPIFQYILRGCRLIPIANFTAMLKIKLIE